MTGRADGNPRSAGGDGAAAGKGPAARGLSAGLHFFADASEMRAWFEARHGEFDELWLGMYKKAIGLPSVDWPEAVDVALCFGWIDGLKRTIDERSYKIRLTPRRRGSNWSDRNRARMRVLIKEGLVAEAGMAAWEARKPRDAAPRPPRPCSPRLPPATPPAKPPAPAPPDSARTTSR